MKLTITRARPPRQVIVPPRTGCRRRLLRVA